MLTIKNLGKFFSAIFLALILIAGASYSYAQDDQNTVITVIDPVTGKVIEAPRLFSEMSEEEKAAYSEEDLKILEAHEAEMKKQAEKPKY